MSAVVVQIEGYSSGSHKPGIEVDQWEGLVHLDTRSLKDDTDQPSMSPAEARALAAALLHAASEAER